MRRRQYHYCAMHHGADGSQHFCDGALEIEGDAPVDVNRLRAKICAAMTPPRENVLIQSLTLIHEEVA